MLSLERLYVSNSSAKVSVMPDTGGGNEAVAAAVSSAVTNCDATAQATDEFAGSVCAEAVPIRRKEITAADIIVVFMAPSGSSAHQGSEFWNRAARRKR